MKRRTLFWIIGISALVIAAPFVAFKFVGMQDERALQEQLRLARQEGLPTNGEEFEASIETAKLEENAAPVYQRLKGLTGSNSDDPLGAAQDLCFRPSSQSRLAARELLQQHAKTLEIADLAASLPRCWFDRDWSQGAGVLLPEYALIKGASKYVALRGVVAADRGEVTSAVKDFEEVFAVAKHAAEEGHMISALVCDSIITMGLRSLASCALANPTRAEYVAAMKRAIESMPAPDLKKERRGDLFNTLSIIDLCETKEGRQFLGLREEDVSDTEKIISLLMNKAQARVRVVEAHRRYWAALALPPGDRDGRLDQANQDISKALLAFPTAAKIYINLSEGGFDGSKERELRWNARRLQYIALCRGIGTNGVSRVINVDGLLSPYDGKPLTYTYDGKQIVITVSGFMNGTNPADLKIPTDQFFGRNEPL